MKITSKIFIIFALICFSAAAAYSQDCNSYLQRATDMVSQKKYCDAKRYYQEYSKCNADADVSTEIAMCDRFCKIQTMEGEGNEPVGISTSAHDVITLKNGSDIQAIVQEISELDVKYKKLDNPNGATYTLKKSEIFMVKYANGSKDVFTDNAATTTSSQSNRTNAPYGTERDYPNSSGNRISSGSTNPKLKLGLNGGLLYPTGEGSKIHFGGGISGEYLAAPNIGIGLSAGYYAYQLAAEGAKLTSSFMPVALNGKYYFLTENIQPYAGVDVGLYIIGAKLSYGGESESGSKSYFGLAPVVGSQFKLSNSLALDVNAKENIIFLEGQIGYNFCFNVGIVFSF